MPKDKTIHGGAQGGDRVSPALAKVVNEAIASTKAMSATLEGQDIASKTAEERLYSNGKLREGEIPVQGVILDTMDKFPGLFASLAARDHGEDDDVLETGPARAALGRLVLLKPLQEELEKLLTRVSDDILESAELVKDVTTPAYAIIKANQAISPDVRKSAAEAINYYASLAKKRNKKSKTTDDK